MSLLGPQLEAFMAIAEFGTVHAAADAVNVTQTAVTQRMRALEAKLSTSLFVRSRRGMLLTPEGEALLRYCFAAQNLAGEALAQITGKGLDVPVEICISGPSSVMHSRIVPACVKVQKDYQNLLLQFKVMDDDIGVSLLQTGKTQLAIIPEEEITLEMQHKLLAPEEYVLVCTSEWKGRALRDIIQKEHIIDFNPADKMTFNYLKYFDLFEDARLERNYANRTNLMAMMLSAGRGYGVLSKEFVQPYLKRKELIMLNRGKVYESAMALVWYDRQEPPQYFSRLIDMIS